LFLHLMRMGTQTNKFALPWITKWESVEPGNHCYIQHSEHINDSLRLSNCSYILSDVELMSVIKNFDNIEGVILSGCQNQKYFRKIIDKIPGNIPICLFSWGEWRCPKGTLYKKTLCSCYKTHSLKDSLLYSINNRKTLSRQLRFLVDLLQDIHIESRIDIFASSNRSEFDYYVKSGSFVNPDVVYHYGTVGGGKKVSVDLNEGNYVQIGNSGSPLNNHLDVFEMVKPILKDGMKVFVPLTYGNVEYIQFVIKRGKRLFGANFVPLTEHLPIEKFREFLKPYGFYISGQTSVTGLGNLHLALKRGAKAFIPKSCPLYNEYKDYGVPIYSLEDDLVGNKDAFTEFAEEEKKYCQSKICEVHNPEKSQATAREVLTLLRKIKTERETCK